MTLRAPASSVSAPVIGAVGPAHPLVSVVMPCLNEERHIEACIRSVWAQDYPSARMEILIADGGSTDATCAILARLCQRDARIAVIENPKRVQAAAMNLLIARARGEIIIRMDVHCEYDTTYVRSCVEVLRETGADNAGGAQRARARTRFQAALCAALDSPLGVGGAAYRSPDKDGFVDTVFLGAYRRDVFDRVGGYDEGALTNEDAELNQRILDAGGTVYLSRDIVVHYSPRESLPALAKQYFRYGAGRARTLLKHRRLPTVRPVLPFCLVATGIALLVVWPLQPLLPVAATSYGAVCVVAAVRTCHRAHLPWRAVPTVSIIFPTLHLAHGVGFAVGLAKYLPVRRRLNQAAPARRPEAPSVAHRA